MKKRDCAQCVERLTKSRDAREQRLEEARIQKRVDEARKLQDEMERGVHRPKKKLDAAKHHKLMTRLYDKPLQRRQAEPEEKPEEKGWHDGLRGALHRKVDFSEATGEWRPPAAAQGGEENASASSMLRSVIFDAAARVVGGDPADLDEGMTKVVDRLHRTPTKVCGAPAPEMPPVPKQFTHGRATHLGPGVGKADRAEPWRSPKPRTVPDHDFYVVRPLQTVAGSTDLKKRDVEKKRREEQESRRRARLGRSKSAPRERTVSAKGFTARMERHEQDRRRRLAAREAKAAAEIKKKTLNVHVNAKSAKIAEKLEPSAERLYKPGQKEPEPEEKEPVDLRSVERISDTLATRLLSPP